MPKIKWVGKTANEVVWIVRHTGRKTRRPKAIGENEDGLIVLWFLPDVTLRLEFVEMQYRVVEELPKTTDEEYEKIEMAETSGKWLGKAKAGA